MPLEQTVTIVNNSGKIISTGKQLLSLFKEAKGSYQDKKAELRSERNVQRSQTFDSSVLPRQHPHRARSDLDARGHHHHHRLVTASGVGNGGDYYDDVEDDEACDYGVGVAGRGDDAPSARGGRRHSHDAAGSETGSRRSRHSSRPRHHHHHHQHHHHHHRQTRSDALTESNLRTLSEVSSTAPSHVSRRSTRHRPPATYRAPYAETMPLDMAMSRLDVARAPAETMSLAPPRRHSESDALVLGAGFGGSSSSSKKIDMDLAYGNIPPDLADRVDLDPKPDIVDGSGGGDRAQQLVRKVEGLLDEAHCLQHSATTIIQRLQQQPDAAAEVALTLADLSKAVAKMSPSLLSLLRTGSPAVFALLASPHFLIGTGIALGATVVMFGGWKIVKKVSDAQQRGPAAIEASPLSRASSVQNGNGSSRRGSHRHDGHDRKHSHRSASCHGVGNEVDEALIVDQELGAIETWRRGIQPPDGVEDAESADLELITPQASRVAARQRPATRSATPDPAAAAADDARSARSGRSSARASDPGNHHRHSRRRAASVSGATEAARPSSSSAKGARSKAAKSEAGGGSGSRSRATRQGDNMLKAIFRSKKKKKEEEGEKKSGGGDGDEENSKKQLVRRG